MVLAGRIRGGGDSAVLLVGLADQPSKEPYRGHRVIIVYEF